MFSSSSYVLHLQAAYPVKTPVAPRPQTCNATRPTMPGLRASCVPAAASSDWTAFTRFSTANVRRDVKGVGRMETADVGIMTRSCLKSIS